MSKNLMSISQKVFSPAAFIARKINKKHKKQTMPVNVETLPESSVVSDLTPAECTDGENSLADVSWRAEEKEQSPIDVVRSVLAQCDVDLTLGGHGKEEDINRYEYPINGEITAAERSQHDDQELTETYALREKVSELEKIVSQQADDLACLKSAMADNSRRLKLLEESKGKWRIGGRSALLSVSTYGCDSDIVDLIPSPNTTQHEISRSMMHLACQPHSPTLPGHNQMSLMKISTTSSQANHKRNQPTNKSPNNTDIVPVRKQCAQTLNTSPRSLSSPKSPRNQNHFGITSNKDASFNKDDGTLKMFIKGRPVHLHVPTFAQPIDMTTNGQLPKETLKLEWVYGYRGRDARSNVYFLPTGEVVYFVAAVVVLYNMEEHTQRHYLGHNDDVKSIAIHPDKITIATGQVAGHSKTEGKPHIRIWSSVNLNTLHVIGLGFFERAVSCLSFSNADGGNLICAVDEANEHVLSVWQWKKERKVVESKCSTDPVLSVDFHPLDGKCLVTCGKNHLVFWTLEDNQLSKKNAIYEKHEKPKFVLCQTFLANGDFVTGDSSGNILIWNKESYKISKALNGGHEGPIFSILMTKNGTLLTGGGKDRLIKEWSAELVSTGVERRVAESHGSTRMLSQGPGGLVLVGSTRNSILQINAQSTDLRPIVEGHIEEMWGIAAHPRQHRFVSVGYDKSVCFWDSLSRQLIWRNELTEDLHCVCFHPLSEIVVIGCTSGRWLVIDTISRGLVTVFTDGCEQIECVQFSVDGRLLALGSRDNSIYIYTVSDNGGRYSRQGKCVGHSSFVTHLDWSINGQYLRSNSGDYEELFWSASTCRQVASVDQVRDLDWQTTNCVIDWSTAGIWPEGADGTDVNAVTRGHHRPLLCTADDFGHVNLYSYPAPHLKSVHHEYCGHSSHVTNVQFLFDDSRLISIGGKDATVMQWEIV